MVKIKEKLNNSICFIKENPIEGTAKYLPILICVFSTLLTIISLILFTTSGGFSHQSIQVNQNFNYEGANLPATKFATILVDLLYLANIIVILIHYYQTQTKSKRIVVVGLFVIGVIAKILFYLCLFEGKPNYVVWAVLAILFFIGIFSYETNEMTKHMMISYIVVKIVLPVILFVVENIGAVVGNILYIIFLIIILWGLIHIFIGGKSNAVESASMSNFASNQQTESRTKVHDYNRKEEKVRIIPVNPSLKIYKRVGIAGYQYVEIINYVGVPCELCSVYDIKEGKAKIINEKTNKEISLSDIPWENGKDPK